MESLIQEPITLPSSKYTDSSDDDDVVLKRNIVKPRVFDSDEEISDIVSGAALEKNSESNSGERTFDKLFSTKTNHKRIIRESDSDSDENESIDLKRSNDSLLISKQVRQSVESGVSAENSSCRASPVLSSAKVSSVSPEFKQKNLFSQSDLYDAEDSEDDTRCASPIESPEGGPASADEGDPKEKSKLKKSKERKVSKSKPAKDNLKKIHSESQRMVRESRVSLPYHRPRQRTLAEFLSRRDHVVLPVKSLKTSPTKMGAVWKTLEEKVKEAEEFYKSDSDSGLDEEGMNSGVEGDQATKEINVGEIEFEKQEGLEQGLPVSNTVITGLIADSTITKEMSSCPLETVLGNHSERVETDQVKSLLDEESTNGNAQCPVIPDVCDLNIGSTALEDSENDPNSSLVSSDPSNFKSGMLTRTEDEKEECGSEVDSGNCGHEAENVNDVSSILNDILDTVTKDAAKSKSDVCVDSDLDNPASSKLSSSDNRFSFSKHEVQESAMTLKSVDCDNRASEVHGDKSCVIIGEVDTNENHGLGKIKIPSPPPLEDSESISLRLDDDTVDEAGPNPEQSHALNAPEMKGNDTDPSSLMQDETDEPRVSTPVRMLRELEGNGDTSLAGDDEVDQPKNAQLQAGTFLSTIQLGGDPDNVIDLDEDVRTNVKKEVGVRGLMERFIKHHVPKKVTSEEKKVDIGIEVVEGGGDKGPEKVKREVMTVTLGGADPIKSASPGTERPGARLRSLREELQREIARKRDEEWAKRQQEYSLDEEVMDGEEGKCSLDDDEEEELTDSSSEEEEEEEVVEDDVDMSTKSRPRSEYVDDEAEESDEEEVEDVDQDNEESNDGSSLEDKEDGLEKEEALVLGNELENEENKEELSNDVKDVDTPTKSNIGNAVDTFGSGKKSKFQRVKTFELFDSEDDADVSNYNDSAAELTSPPSTPLMPNRNRAQGRLSLPSPALPLTALQRYTNSPTIGQTSPWAFSQKNFFDDEESPKQSKDEKDSLRGKSALINLVGQSQGSEVPEDELLNLMSGAFLSRSHKMSEAEDDFSLALEDTQDLFDKSQSKVRCKEELSDESGLKDSQRIGGSSWNDNLSFTFNNQNDDNDNKEMVLDDDMENVMKRKKLKRLDISDDEEDEQVSDRELKISQDIEDDAESDGDSEGVEGSEVDESDDEKERVVEYDSEENAIVVERAVKKTRGPRRGLEFLEAEAELSEGEEEWAGSGDEDERGLDRMEKEAGDVDKLDDEMVRRELGRIHMRQVLDEDKREVRLLQEIFLEDGELHADGQGRERKFRWRNVDTMDDADYRPMDSGDEEKVEDEDENEEKWRRLRHERETWLREHQQGKNQDPESLFNDIEEDSQLLKLGRAALRRTNSFPSNTLTKWLKPSEEPKDKDCEPSKPPEKDPGSPDVKRPFQMLCKRGSFLARKDGTLERLAEIAIKSGVEPECLTSTSPVVAKTKHSHKFVFTVLSPEKKNPKASVEAPKEVSLPVRRSIKRKKKELKEADGIAKKSKSVKEASIFQFL